MKKKNLFIALFAAFMVVLAMSVCAETKVTMFAKDGRSIQITPSAVEQYKAVGWYEGVVMWAPDERCKVVSPFNVEAEKAVGWSTTPVELKFTEETKDYAFGNGVLQVYTNPGYRDYDCRYDIKKVFISSGVTSIDSFAFIESSNIKRVEISDTVTTIESYAFDDIEIERIGIPKTIKTLNPYCFDTFGLTSSQSCNTNMTVYCEAGSAAEDFAKKYNLKYVYATMIYSLDGRTMMVDDKEKSAYVSSGLWGETPITKMYAADGRTKVVPISQVEANKAVGWYTEPVVQMWAADGRSKGVPKDKVEAEKKVGWYENKADVMVKMYAKDGRKKEVFKGQVEAEKKVGWYEGVTMYAPDGRSKVVSPFKVDAEKKVGWLTEIYPKNVYTTANLSLYEGETSKLPVSFAPEYATEKDVTWSSSNTAVATVDKNGKVTAIAKGNAKIYVKTSNGLKTSCYVEVKKVPSVSAPVGGQKLTKSGRGLGFFTNSADGVTVFWTATNNSKKTVNYYTVHFTMYNAVGDYAYCQINRTPHLSKKIVGPVAAGEELVIYSVIGYSSVCSKVAITHIDLEYADGTKETVQYGYYGVEDLWDKYDNNWLKY